MTDIRQGGCLCGKARYEIDLTDHETGNCHCRDCQKNSGAPFVTNTLVPTGQFKWISKPKGEYSASSAAIRRFCIECGTPLQWDGMENRDLVDVSTSTLDDPSGIAISYEIYTRSRMDGVLPVPGAQQFEAAYGTGE